MKTDSSVVKQLNAFLKTSEGASYFTVAATVIMLIVLFLFGVFPTISTILFQTTENEKRADYLDKANTKMATLDKLYKDGQDKIETVKRLNYYFPDAFNQEAVYTELNDLVAKHSIILTSLAFSEVDQTRRLDTEYRTDSPLRAKIVRVSVSGARSALVNFLKDIESAPRLYNPKNVTLFPLESSQQTGGQVDQYGLEIQLETFYWDTTLPS